jgi:acyl-CoA reductase-like NAD-dependent aldehyde dehydrogenase
MGENYGNLINGLWRPAGAGEGFVVADAGGAELGRRMRASAGDLEEALGGLEEASRSWWMRSSGERGEILDSLDLGDGLEGCAAGVAARIGVSSEEAKSLLEEDLGELEEWNTEPVGGPGVSLVRCAPTALLSGLASLMMQSLERGWTVLLLADPELPWLAELLADAWLRAGAPAEALALLHDDGLSCARSALGSGRLSAVALCDLDERIQSFQAKLKLHESASIGMSFGAGVAEGGGSDSVFYGVPLRDATSVVTSDCDPVQEAVAVVEASFGSALALSGEREGSIGRVICHERQFSVFTGALLEAFDVLEQQNGPLLRPLMPKLDGWMTALSQSAVGEGATSLRGGASDSNERVSRGKMGRSVFTNLEPNWSFACAGRPAPALSLLRAPDDEKAHELALSCDSDPAQLAE